MFLLLTRWLKGLIIGWITGLIFAMIGRMLERALGGSLNGSMADSMRRGPQSDSIKRPHTGPQDNNIIDTIWVGMSAAQLQSTLGHPTAQHTNTDGSFLWSYPNMDVTLERNTVKGWTYKN